ncbi:MAG: gliding motility-associated C-terminal domain-containing protein [Saprospiraceae bacterium]|nr:gliding motility-associated C-terminal domain-containing protein [Saprospiraceae bacterium]
MALEIAFSKHARFSKALAESILFLAVIFIANPVWGQYTFYSLPIHGFQTHCIDTDAFRGNKPSLAEITCEKVSQDQITYTVDVEAGCINIISYAAPGRDTICIDFCNADRSVCESANIIVSTYEAPTTMRDEIYYGMTGQHCSLIFPDLTGQVIEVREICGGEIPPIVNWTVSPNKKCILYEGVNVGNSRGCLEAQDDNGMMDTIFFEVVVKNTVPELISAQVEEGQMVNLCHEDLELAGVGGSPVEFCTEGDAASVVYLDTENCFEVSANTPGSSYNCFVFCDSQGVCDTVELDIMVLARMDLTVPQPQDDSFTALVGQTNFLNVCSNDVDTENITSFRVLPFAEGGIGPYAGSVVANMENCSLEYEPLSNACDMVDSLIYEVCIEDRCDQAKVLIGIECGNQVEGLLVRNGFSPNGDGKNETLWIEGLEEYPDHSLVLYNRWGTEVYEASDYQNDWRGTWQGADLPEGVYYYLFNDGEGAHTSGWIYMNR